MDFLKSLFFHTNANEDTNRDAEIEPKESATTRADAIFEIKKEVTLVGPLS